MSSPGVDGPEVEEADEEADEAEAEEVVSSVRWRLLAGAADASLAELMARRDVESVECSRFRRVALMYCPNTTHNRTAATRGGD